MWWHIFKLLFGFSPVRLDCLSMYASCRVHEVERMINCAMAKLQSWADVMNSSASTLYCECDVIIHKSCCSRPLIIAGIYSLCICLCYAWYIFHCFMLKCIVQRFSYIMAKISYNLMRWCLLLVDQHDF
jgi:hypothetical protein